MNLRRILLPVCVILLGLVAIGSIVVLQQRADDGRRAELKLAGLKLELAALQNAPFHASASTGGSPRIAANLLAVGKAQLARTLLELERTNPPPALAQLGAPLAANLATLDLIYEIGATTHEYGPQADRLAGMAARSQDEAGALLDAAGAEYGRRALRSDREATAGAVLAIVFLLGAFGLLYRKNRRLLATSRHEALVDALTGLRNRRALVSDLDAGLSRASTASPLLLALFDLDGFKAYNDTFGHPAGDALLTRLGARMQAALPSNATAYRMGGDEFCVLATGAHESDQIVRQASAALTQASELVGVSCSYGSVRIPLEATSSEQALHVADQRMYARKQDRGMTHA